MEACFQHWNMRIIITMTSHYCRFSSRNFEFMSHNSTFLTRNSEKECFFFSLSLRIVSLGALSYTRCNAAPGATQVFFASFSPTKLSFSCPAPRCLISKCICALKTRCVQTHCSALHGNASKICILKHGLINDLWGILVKGGILKKGKVTEEC